MIPKRKTLANIWAWLRQRPQIKLKHVQRLLGLGRAGLGYASQVLRAMRVEASVSPREMDRLPLAGGVLLMLDRPYGLVEGCALVELLGAVRLDLRFIHDEVLEADAAGATFCLGPGSDDERWRRAALQLRQGALVVAFVQRSASRSPQRPAGAAHDLNLRLAVLARETGCAVQAAHWKSGKRRLALRALGLDKPGLRRAVLSRGPLAKAGARLELQLGAPVPPSRLKAFASDAEAAEYLALRQWLLRHRGRRATERAPLASSRRVAKLRPLASALPREILQQELDALPPQACLARSGELACYLAEAWAIPSLLREIGRQREETFRAVGEGSGQPLDLDRFDQHYLHLFLWHRGDSAVAGGYRLGPTDVILRAHGPAGLYTQTLLKMRPALLAQLEPGLEMGRSFVAPAYQRSFAPLMLLWKGVGSYVAANPHYRRLFGMVSMSAEYQPLSRELIASYIKQHLFRGDLAKLAVPRRPFAPAYSPSRHDAVTWRLGRDLEEVSAWISELEHDGKGLPVLFKQYARLGGEFFGFNVDPAFGHALDGMVCVDLLHTETRTLEKYLGVAGAAQFQAFHAKAAAL
jgi:putative hemolysin